MILATSGKNKIQNKLPYAFQLQQKHFTGAASAKAHFLHVANFSFRLIFKQSHHHEQQRHVLARACECVQLQPSLEPPAAEIEPSDVLVESVGRFGVDAARSQPVPNNTLPVFSGEQNSAP